MFKIVKISSILLFVCFLVHQINHSTPPMKESNLFTIRIDQYGQYWWNIDRVTQENLPKLIKPVYYSSDTLNYDTYNDSLKTVMKNLYIKNPQFVFMIIMHPETYYLELVNIINILKSVTDKVVYEKTVIIDSVFSNIEGGWVRISALTKTEYSIIKVSLSKWSESDTKKIEAAYEKYNIPKLGVLEVTDNLTVAYKIKHRYWPVFDRSSPFGCFDDKIKTIIIDKIRIYMGYPSFEIMSNQTQETNSIPRIPDQVSDEDLED